MDPRDVALMQSFKRSRERQPGIGTLVLGALVGAGVGAALYYLLKPAYEDEPEGDASSAKASS
jgi:hypothetical protein